MAVSKSTIEPCSGSDACTAMVGYTLYTSLKVAEVATLFQVDTVALLAANAFDVSGPDDLDHHILPAKLFLKVPVPCPCTLGIRRSSARYRTRPSDTLPFVASSVYSGIVSPDQIADANSIPDPSAPLDSGISLTIPLPCTCFNSSDNSLPAVFLSYVVSPSDSLSAIAARYFTTVTDVMNVNAMGSMAVRPGDILSVPIPGTLAALSI